MSTPPHASRRRRLPAAVVASSIAAAGCLAGCTVADATDDEAVPATAVTSTPAAIDTAAPASIDVARLLRYTDKLRAHGFPDVIPPQTVYALADGVCRQSAGGTPDPAILDHVRPMAAYAAGLSDGAFTADTATRLLVDTARSDFC